MKRLSILGFIFLFLIILNQSLFAKSIFESALNASYFDLIKTSGQGEEKAGVILNNNIELEDISGTAQFIIKKRKLKKGIIFYGDVRGGELQVTLLKINTDTGEKQEVIPVQHLSFINGEAAISFANTLTKSKKEKWFLVVILFKEQVSDESPIFYGFKYTS